MGYEVKEIIYTLQGEGAHAGRPVVLCRFAGCNLWSGREADRASATCRFCDTDFVGTDGPGGGVFGGADALAEAVAVCWPVGESGGAEPMVLCTGGEPLLQLDAPLVGAMHDRGFKVAAETNGTLPPPAGVDWVCVSPKAGVRLRLQSGDELKIVYPQEGLDPADFELLAFRYTYLQPMDGSDVQRHTQLAVQYCLAHPRWRLSLQMHKLLCIP